MKLLKLIVIFISCAASAASADAPQFNPTLWSSTPLTGGTYNANNVGIANVANYGSTTAFANTTAISDEIARAIGAESVLGSFTQSGNGAVSRTVQSKLSESVSVLDFGAIPNDSLDDTAAIQAAINSLSTSGGTVFFQPGVYTVTSTLNIGNGSNTAMSTANSIKLKGAGSDPYAIGGVQNSGTAKSGTSLQWSGASGATFISINGSGDDYGINGIDIDCNQIAGIGLTLLSVRASNFENFSIRNFTSIGLNLQITALGGILQGKLNHGSANVFKQFIINSYVQTELKALSITGWWPGQGANSADWYRNTFIDGLFQVRRPLSTSLSYSSAAYIEFADHNTFIACDFTVWDYSTTGLGNAYGLYLNGTNNNGYPQNNFFYGSSVLNVQTQEVTGTGAIGNNFFYNFTTQDGEIVPTHPKLKGITDIGNIFGSFTTNSDFSINTNSASLSLITRPGSTDYRGYLLNANDNGTTDNGFSIVKKNYDNSNSTVFSLGFSGDSTLFFTGLGLRQVQYGAADSAGTGYRTLMIAN